MTLPRDVSARLEVRIDDATELEMQITVAKLAGLQLHEELKIELDGSAVAVEELVADHGSRIHRMQLDRGLLTIDYTAEILTPRGPDPGGEHRPVAVSASQPICRVRQVLRVRRRTVRPVAAGG